MLGCQSVTCPLAKSYLNRAAHEAGAAAEMAASRKEEKYVDLGARYIFERIAVETLGVFNASARHLLGDLRRMYMYACSISKFYLELWRS